MSSPTDWVIYQPLIVGLGAVVLATLGNTALEWYRQRLSHVREARKVRHAFLEEISIHRTFFAESMPSEEGDANSGSFLIPIIRFQPVYDSMIGSIAVLEPDEISAILHAYSSIMLLPKNLAVLGRFAQDDYSAWLEVGIKYRPVVANMHQKIVTACDEAIATLSKRARR